MRLMVVAGLGLALLGGGVAQAQTPELAGADLEDVQCFSVFATIAGESRTGPDGAAESESEKAIMLMAMMGGMMYHLGRLEGRAPDTDWLEQIATYARSVEAEDLQPLSERCGRALSVKGEALVTWGARVQQD